jgi:hypothetical protein
MAEPKRLLELFSGTGSIGKPWREAGHEVVSVDIDNKYHPEVCENILTWNYQSQTFLKPYGPVCRASNTASQGHVLKHREITTWRTAWLRKRLKSLSIFKI